ncbi:MAG: ATP synthase F1 subunit gamma [Oscillospiraceae bacterium]
MAGANMKDIRRRIKSVESTMQITKAMELVASSKLRKAKERVERSRPFFNILYETMVEIAFSNKDFTSIYTQERSINKVGIIVVAGDRGLAGGYNANVLKHAQTLAQGKDTLIIPIGKKVADFFVKRGFEVYDTGFSTVEELGMDETYEIARMAATLFRDGEIDELQIVYTQFMSMLSQVPNSMKVLPLNFGDEDITQNLISSATDFEPSPADVFATIVPQYLCGVIFGAVAESYASEQGARRTAMEAASDNAGDIIEDLNLKFNRARQAAITQQITEIVGGAQALS